jgi:hypothetical protein
MTWLALALLAGCNGGKDTSNTGETGTPQEHYSILGDESTLPAAALLSVWGPSADDMWMVGADPGDGPMALHWDGSAWARIDTSAYPGDLWWVRGAPGSDYVWMSGADGRVLQYSRSTGAIVEHQAADPTYKMFGVYAFADDDVWAVGGDINNNADGIVVHWDGTAWTTSWLIPPNGTTRREAFKIWGSGPTDIYVVGTRALVAHYDGTTWTDLPYMGYEANTYFTVDGTGPDDVYVVGGESNAAVLHWDGSTWEDLSPNPAELIVPIVSGVSASEAYGTAICGNYGSIFWRAGTAWEEDPRARGTQRDLHACWIDDTGNLWAVGDAGDLTRPVVLYSGADVPPISL